jgi:hypothetical protein
MSPYALSSSLVVRLNALSKFRQEMNLCARRDEILKQQLFDLAPYGLQNFLKDNGVLNSLIEFGQCSIKVTFDQALGDLATIKFKLKKLQRAWRQNVIISFGKPETCRIEILFLVAHPTV